MQLLCVLIKVKRSVHWMLEWFRSDLLTMMTIWTIVASVKWREFLTRLSLLFDSLTIVWGQSSTNPTSSSFFTALSTWHQWPPSVQLSNAPTNSVIAHSSDWVNRWMFYVEFKVKCWFILISLIRRRVIVFSNRHGAHHFKLLCHQWMHCDAGEWKHGFIAMTHIDVTFFSIPLTLPFPYMALLLSL